MEEKSILSVGIDIGTTTTQLIFSILKLRNTAGATQAPRYSITGREIIYESPIVFTPKTSAPSSEELDRAALDRVIAAWYAEAGLSRESVDTGAVIVTGESLKSANAKTTVMELSARLGDFVVATAGPRLESIIAGRGSGAAALSESGKTVLNIDIGGGTSNYAVFRLGNVLDAACLNVGGRLLRTDEQGRVQQIAPSLHPVLKDLFGQVSTSLEPNALLRLADRLADLIYDTAAGKPCSLARILLQTQPLKPGYHYDAVTISGGVGECMRQPGGDPFRYGDLGPLLAQALLRHPGLRSLPLTPPSSTVRATVIGAGSWFLSLSGSTVWAESEAFPLRNLPVVIIPTDWPREQNSLAAFLRERIALYDLDPEVELFALAFGNMQPTYADVHSLAMGLADFWRAVHWKSAKTATDTLVVALQADAGKALGMELRPLLPDCRLIVVDEVRLADGDYLDLGKPITRGGLVPLVVKSLAFSGER